MTQKPSGIVAEHIRAVNAFDCDAIVATFAKDAYVNDNKREIVGIAAIRRWVEKEMVGDHVTIEVREVLEHYGDTIVRGAYDGEYDKTKSGTKKVVHKSAHATSKAADKVSGKTETPKTEAPQ